MRGKWAAGIPPRNFTWIIRDRLAVSERPGGFAPTHRRVRRKEEIIWLRVQGFNRVVSLLPSPHNLAAYEEEGLEWANYPLTRGIDPRTALLDFYQDLQTSIASSQHVLVHQEELGDRVMGAVGGFLVWSGRLNSGPQAVALMEQVVGQPMGPAGRELVVVADELPTGGSSG